MSCQIGNLVSFYILEEDIFDGNACDDYGKLISDVSQYFEIEPCIDDPCPDGWGFYKIFDKFFCCNDDLCSGFWDFYNSFLIDVKSRLLQMDDFLDFYTFSQLGYDYDDFMIIFGSCCEVTITRGVGVKVYWNKCRVVSPELTSIKELLGG